MDSLTSEAFRRWYESRNLTQKQVAGLLGIGQRRVSYMATGRVPVSRQTERQCVMASTIARAHCVPLEVVSEGIDRACELIAKGGQL